MDNMKYYEKQKLIGKGSFGSAYLVKSTINQKLYVTKTIELPSNLSGAPVSDKWYSNEISMSQKYSLRKLQTIPFSERQ